MKVYTKIVIDMNSLETVYEESYEYEGPVDLCKGGGGASGKVDFPTYMKTVHNDWLDSTGTDTMTSSMVDAMNAAMANSPFATATAFNPDTDITDIEGFITDFDTLIALLDTTTKVDTLIDNVIDDTQLIALSDKFDDDLSDQLDSNVYPRFEAGMRDINAVMSSAFVIGRAIIEDARTRESAKFLANLRYKASSDDALRIVAMKLQAQQTLAQMGIEAKRIKIVAKSEENTTNVKYDESDAKWDMEVFQYGGNLLASISGAAHAIPNKEGNSTGSMIGGALVGAAAGGYLAAGTTFGASVLTGASAGMAGGPAGAMVGAAVGLGMALLS